MIHLLASDYSIILLIKGGNLSGTHSYQALVQSTFGFPGFLVLSALQFLYPFIGEYYFGVHTCALVIHSIYSLFVLCFIANKQIPALSFLSDDQLQHHNWWHADQSVPENPRRCSGERNALHIKYRNTWDTWKKILQPAVGPGHILAKRHFVIFLSTVVFTLPLSLYRNIEKLGKVSLITDSPLHVLQPSVFYFYFF